MQSQRPTVGLGRAWFFRIGLLVLALCGFVNFFANIADRMQFSVHGVRATITRATPTQQAPIGTGWLNGQHDFYVKATTANGKESFLTLFLSRQTIEQLVDGGRVEIVYVRDNPRRHLLKGEPLPSVGVGWVLFGFAAFAAFWYSLRLR